MPLTILGAYGGSNIGDEVILDTVTSEFERRGYERPYTVVGLGKIANAPQQDWYRERGLRYVDGRDLMATARAVWGSHLFIGGGQLIDGSHGPKLATLQLMAAVFAKASGRKVALGGVGVYRIETGAMIRTLYSLLFHLADSIGIRDAGSLEAIQFSTAGRAKGLQTADIVFSLVDPASSASEGRKTIAFSVHNAPHAQYSEPTATLRLIARLIKLPGFDVIVTAHDRRRNFDAGFAKNLLAQLPSGSATLRKFNTVEECLRFYRTCHTVVSARMHPVIIGACLGANCVPLAGSPKMSEVADLLQIPLQRPESLIALGDEDFVKALGIKSTIATPDRQALANLQLRALENFRVFPPVVPTDGTIRRAAFPKLWL